jgi:hypothetical protein
LFRAVAFVAQQALDVGVKSHGGPHGGINVSLKPAVKMSQTILNHGTGVSVRSIL